MKCDTCKKQNSCKDYKKAMKRNSSWSPIVCVYCNVYDKKKVKKK